MGKKKKCCAEQTKYEDWSAGTGPAIARDTAPAHQNSTGPRLERICMDYCMISLSRVCFTEGHGVCEISKYTEECGSTEMQTSERGSKRDDMAVHAVRRLKEREQKVYNKQVILQRGK